MMMMVKKGMLNQLDLINTTDKDHIQDIQLFSTEYSKGTKDKS